MHVCLITLMFLSQITAQGSNKIRPLIWPPRGIYAVGPMLIEYYLVIKGQERKDDKVLIDGHSMYAPSFYSELHRYRWHIDTGHCGTVALEMVALDKAVLGTLELEVLDLGENCFDSLYSCCRLLRTVGTIHDI